MLAGVPRMMPSAASTSAGPAESAALTSTDTPLTSGCWVPRSTASSISCTAGDGVCCTTSNVGIVLSCPAVISANNKCNESRGRFGYAPAVPDDWFDSAVAMTYDDDESEMFEPGVVGTTVDVLERLAGSGSALEFAIGTGRVALPLAARGVPVSGIELSTAMLSQLRAKRGGDEAAIPVVVGDMATARTPHCGTSTLVYLVFNTITNLTAQVEQVACFQNAARHLAPGGFFVVETFVPRLRSLLPRERLVPLAVTDDFIGIDEYDTVEQQLTCHYVQTRETLGRSSMPFRYVW